jgi:hypothetical protein
MKAGTTPLDFPHKRFPTRMGAPSHLDMTQACIMKNLQLIKKPLGAQEIVQQRTHYQ